MGLSRRYVLALGLALSLVALAAPTLGQGQLDAVRASGEVGERFDGLAAVRDAGAGADVRTLVDDVNAQRRALYSQRANSEGVTVDAVGRIYAAQIFRAAPAGTWFLQESGQWVQK